MNTQHLKYAIEVGKTGSITQAAENLYIGQPSLSKALKELEESLGISIFKRTSKGAVPTVQGERFLVYAREVLRQVEQMEKLAHADHLTAQTFHVSVPRVSYINNAVMETIRSMDAQKEMDVRIMQCSAICGIQHVADGMSELAVIRYPVRYERYFLDYLEEKKLCSDLVWEGEPEILMYAGHPLRNKPSITREDLKQFPQVEYADEKVPYLASEEAEEGSGGRRIIVSDTDGMRRALTAIPIAYAIHYGLCGDQKDMICRRVDGFGRMKDVIVYPNDYTFRNQDRQLINQIYIEKNKLLYGTSVILEME